MYYNIICKYKDDGLTEEVASDLSYGEMCQYLLDCFENEDKPRFDLKVMEEELYNKTNKLLYNSIVKNKWIVFDDYKLKVKEFKKKNEN